MQKNISNPQGNKKKVTNTQPIVCPPSKQSQPHKANHPPHNQNHRNMNPPTKATHTLREAKTKV
ncbi:MAG: hypothetical protein WCQ95_01175 [Bacteroidota bacterium]